MLPALCTPSVLISASHCFCHKVTQNKSHLSLHIQHSCNPMPSSREAEHVASAAKQPQLSPPLSVSQALSITVATLKAQTVGLDRSPGCGVYVRGLAAKPVRSMRPIVWTVRPLSPAPRCLAALSSTHICAPLIPRARSSSSGHPPHRPKQSRLCEMLRGAWRLPRSLIIPAWGSGCVFLG